MSVFSGNIRKFAKKKINQIHPQPFNEQNAINGNIPLRSYGDFKLGPEVTIDWETNQTEPFDGSNSYLKSLSPFIIRLEPPAIYANSPSLLHKDYKKLPFYSSAIQEQNNVFKARQNLTQKRLGATGLKYNQEYVIPNNNDGSKNTAAPTIAHLGSALDQYFQLESILNTPPLVLLINPTSMSITTSKIQQFTDRSRFGFIFQSWGEDLPYISLNFKCGAFISGGRGVSWASRHDSAAWQNFMALLMVFRSNGYIYDTLDGSQAHLMIGSVSLEYDGKIYFGHIENINYSFDDTTTANGGVAMDIQFIVSEIYDPTDNSLPLPMSNDTLSLDDPRINSNNPPALRGNNNIIPFFRVESTSSFPTSVRNTGVSRENLNTNGFRNPTSTATVSFDQNPKPFKVTKK